MGKGFKKRVMKQFTLVIPARSRNRGLAVSVTAKSYNQQRGIVLP